jgi:hypothetical protein
MSRKTEYIIQDIPKELLGKRGIVRYNRTVRKSNRGSLKVYEGLIGKKFHLILIPTDDETKEQIEVEPEVQETAGMPTQEA